MSLKFDFHKLVGQGYDGASIMSGQQAGVAAIIRDQYAPMADYYHCTMHALNLSCTELSVFPLHVRHAQDILAQTTSVLAVSLNELITS